MSLLNNFSKHLEDIRYPNEKEKNQQWHIEGRIKNKSNQIFKFDIEKMFLQSNGVMGKKGKTISKADKMVFDLRNQWLIVDMKELINYVVNNKINSVSTEEIIKNLEWNILLNK